MMLPDPVTLVARSGQDEFTKRPPAGMTMSPEPDLSNASHAVSSRATKA